MPYLLLKPRVPPIAVHCRFGSPAFVLLAGERRHNVHQDHRRARFDTHSWLLMLRFQPDRVYQTARRVPPRRCMALYQRERLSFEQGSPTNSPEPSVAIASVLRQEGSTWVHPSTRPMSAAPGWSRCHRRSSKRRQPICPSWPDAWVARPGSTGTGLEDASGRSTMPWRGPGTQVADGGQSRSRRQADHHGPMPAAKALMNKPSC